MRQARERATRTAAPENERDGAGQPECRWQRAQLPGEIREPVPDDQRLRNEKCWFLQKYLRWKQIRLK